MKNMLTLIVLLSSWLTVYSQESYTETELKQKCDSIVEEANTLYRYETAAWNFTDMIFAKPGLIETIQNILTYHQGDSIKCVAIDKQSYCIYEATFLNESAPCSEVTTRRNLTEQEILLGVSRYGDDTEGMSEELKGDVLVLDLKTGELVKKYEGVAGVPVDVKIKYQKWLRDGKEGGNIVDMLYF